MRPTRADKAWIAVNAHKWKPKPEVKIDHEGQPCRKCSTPVVKVEREPGYKPGPNRDFYLLWWFKCPKCKTVYLVDDAKRFTSDLEGSKASLDELFEDEKGPKAVPEEIGFVDDGRPPFDCNCGLCTSNSESVKD
jgi:hypothetical protein